MGLSKFGGNGGGDQTKYATARDNEHKYGMGNQSHLEAKVQKVLEHYKVPKEDAKATAKVVDSIAERHADDIGQRTSLIIDMVEPLLKEQGMDSGNAGKIAGNVARLTNSEQKQKHQFSLA